MRKSLLYFVDTDGWYHRVCPINSTGSWLTDLLHFSPSPLLSTLRSRTDLASVFVSFCGFFCSPISPHLTSFPLDLVFHPILLVTFEPLQYCATAASPQRRLALPSSLPEHLENAALRNLALISHPSLILAAPTVHRHSYPRSCFLRACVHPTGIPRTPDHSAGAL